MPPKPCSVGSETGTEGCAAGAGGGAAGARPASGPGLRTVDVHLVEAGGDDGDACLVAEGVVDHGAEDDVGLRVGDFLDQAGGLVDLEQAEVRAALDGQQHAVRAVDRCLQQRGGDGQSPRP